LLALADVNTFVQSILKFRHKVTYIFIVYKCHYLDLWQ